MTKVKSLAAALALTLCASPALATTIVGFGGGCDFATCNGLPAYLTGVSTYPLEIQVSAVINYAIDLQLDQPPNETSTYTVDGGIYIWDTDGDGIASFNATPGHWTVTGSMVGAEGTLYASGKFTFTPAYYLDPQELLVDPWAGFAGCSGYCQGSGQILDDTFGSVNGYFAYPAVPEPWSIALLGVGLFGLGIVRRHVSP